MDTDLNEEMDETKIVVRRKRRNALHAETSEEYMDKIDQVNPFSPLHKNKSQSCDGFIQQFNFEFTEDMVVATNESDWEMWPQVNHRILLISSDMSLTHNRITQLLRRNSQQDEQDSSTFFTDDYYSQESSEEVLPFDIYLTKQLVQGTQHSYQFHILNTTEHKNMSLYEDLYFRKFEALILISSDDEIIYNKLISCNPKVKIIYLVEEQTPNSPKKKKQMKPNRGSISSSLQDIMDNLSQGYK